MTNNVKADRPETASMKMKQTHGNLKKKKCGRAMAERQRDGRGRPSRNAAKRIFHWTHCKVGHRNITHTHTL